VCICVCVSVCVCYVKSCDKCWNPTRGLQDEVCERCSLMREMLTAHNTRLTPLLHTPPSHPSIAPSPLLHIYTYISPSHITPLCTWYDPSTLTFVVLSPPKDAGELVRYYRILSYTLHTPLTPKLMMQGERD
jgi:hypothetical protein